MMMVMCFSDNDDIQSTSSTANNGVPLTTSEQIAPMRYTDAISIGQSDDLFQSLCNAVYHPPAPPADQVFIYLVTLLYTWLFYY
jgi:hypothetical protein